MALLAIAKATTIAFAMDPLLQPNQAKFQGKAMRIRVLGYFGVIGAVPVAWWLRGHRDPYPVGTDLMLSVPILLDAGGNAMGVYERANIDDAVHFANAAILMTAFGRAISPRTRTPLEAAALTVGFGAAGEAAWEIMEFLAQKAGFRGMNLTYEDTMADTLESFLGSLVAAAITFRRWREVSAN